MRFIFNKTSNEIIGVIEERITSTLPPTFVDNNSDYIDVDYDEEALNKKNELALSLEKSKGSFLGRTIIVDRGSLRFKDKPEEKKTPTVIIDTMSPEFHKDVRTYAKKAEKLGATVEINDSGTYLTVVIKARKKTVGKMRFIRRGCCQYLYQEGKVFDRTYTPHYIGLLKVAEYLKVQKVRQIDLGGLSESDEELNTFKKKWGKVV